MEDEGWNDSGRKSQTQKGSGGKTREGKKRQQREANEARAMKKKGHVQEETPWILLWLRVKASACLSACVRAVCVCV